MLLGSIERTENDPATFRALSTNYPSESTGISEFPERSSARRFVHKGVQKRATVFALDHYYSGGSRGSPHYLYSLEINNRTVRDSERFSHAQPVHRAGPVKDALGSGGSGLPKRGIFFSDPYRHAEASRLPSVFQLRAAKVAPRVGLANFFERTLTGRCLQDHAQSFGHIAHVQPHRHDHAGHHERTEAESSGLGADRHRRRVH